MRQDVIMPQLGESVHEGTIVKWHAKIGDVIERDDVLLEISTDKVDTEIPSPNSGKLVEILIEEGNTVEIGSVIAVLETDNDSVAVAQPEASPEPKVDPAPVQETPEAVTETEATTQPAKSKRFLSPLIRSIARRENIPAGVLDSLEGTGKDGRLRKEDVLHYLETRTKGVQPEAKEATPTSPAALAVQISFDGDVKRVPMNHMRKSIAEHMVTSARTSPHVTSLHEIDVSGIMEHIEKNQAAFQQREGVKLTLTAYIVQAAAQALKAFPAVNASIDGDDVVYHKHVNIGMAVALEHGLIVPVIRDADRLSISGLAKTIYDLASRARNKKLNPDEVQGGTFSITNFGVFNTVLAMPIINQPQVAILGMGAAKQRVVVVEGMIAIRWMMYLALTYDHRLLDGAQGGQFLQHMTRILEDTKAEELRY